MERKMVESVHCGRQRVGNSDHKVCDDRNSDEKRHNINSV